MIDPYVNSSSLKSLRKTGLDVYEGGLTVTTNIDMDVMTSLRYHDGILTVIEFPDLFARPVFLIDVNTGAIQAVGGGRNQNVQLGVIAFPLRT